MYLEYHTVVVLCQFFSIWRKKFLVHTYLVYNTVVRLCQFFCCCGKANLVRIFLLNPRIFFSYFLLCMDLQPYSHDCFSKISRTLFDFRNNTYWVSLFQRRLQRNNALIFRTRVSCFSVTLFYSILLALTDGQSHRRRNEYTRYAWAGGTSFPAVLLCQFSVLAGNRFWFYILLMYLEYHTVVVLCQFFQSGGKWFLVCTYLVYNTVVQLCQFLLLWWES